MEKKEVLSVLVDNHSGVLARVSSLFGRRGYNIDSLTVSATNDPHISRITIVVSGDETVISQIISQTRKLVETRDIFALNENRSLLRELLLVKLAANESKRSAIREVAEIYGAAIVDLSVDSMIVELTGAPTKIDAFLEVIKEYDIVEMCRTGITALERGIQK
ncbi:MAG: acetolactate synthase small subunit [Methanocorpusculum sp.]|uniref:Acetolactate synthase small subunit n=1 Tax=Methanocorpusculum petauri TaxID=3002863 RepID=A0ABT4IH34_9EURY|nr:acetolactate synthase small subunit [Methanocorpusculum petauri]MDE2443623.1 acetolactate synthase small subunit [Methanocorpusculum sp.]MCZ0861055.1 acetolactate synthase small subunit [Methanocorpusculum petauri]MDE2443628.1 acetolactate synthase small subunit [Methanocorpusculum sp.]MDE2522106.1 acetolactate synthase small subunit [Methanocorpusculum sp.]MDE2524301.1 acetolactate synthase small subunit [Methanocorpusculum sp.]